MARPTKPASLSQTHRYSKEEKRKMDIVEREMSKYADNISSVPVEIENDEIAIQYYQALVHNILQAGIPISDIDIPLLSQASFALSMSYQAKQDIYKHGTIEEKYDRNGNMVGTSIRAIVKIEQSYSEQYSKIAIRLGLDPTSRATIARTQIIDMVEEDDGIF